MLRHNVLVNLIANPQTLLCTLYCILPYSKSLPVFERIETHYENIIGIIIHGIIISAVIHDSGMDYDRWCFIPELYIFCRMG